MFLKPLRVWRDFPAGRDSLCYSNHFNVSRIYYHGAASNEESLCEVFQKVGRIVKDKTRTVSKVTLTLTDSEEHNERPKLNKELVDHTTV